MMEQKFMKHLRKYIHVRISFFFICYLCFLRFSKNNLRVAFISYKFLVSSRLGF